MKRITTRNSVYEIDEEGRKARRLHGTVVPNLPKDGEWRDYTDVAIHDNGVLFVWTDTGKATITTAARSVEEVSYYGG